MSCLRCCAHEDGRNVPPIWALSSPPSLSLPLADLPDRESGGPSRLRGALNILATSLLKIRFLIREGTGAAADLSRLADAAMAWGLSELDDAEPEDVHHNVSSIYVAALEYLRLRNACADVPYDPHVAAGAVGTALWLAKIREFDSRDDRSFGERLGDVGAAFTAADLRSRLREGPGGAEDDDHWGGAFRPSHEAPWSDERSEGEGNSGDEGGLFEDAFSSIDDEDAPEADESAENALKSGENDGEIMRLTGGSRRGRASAERAESMEKSSDGEEVAQGGLMDDEAPVSRDGEEDDGEFLEEEIEEEDGEKGEEEEEEEEGVAHRGSVGVTRVRPLTYPRVVALLDELVRFGLEGGENVMTAGQWRDVEAVCVARIKGAQKAAVKRWGAPREVREEAYTRRNVNELFRLLAASPHLECQRIADAVTHAPTLVTLLAPEVANAVVARYDALVGSSEPSSEPLGARERLLGFLRTTAARATSISSDGHARALTAMDGDSLGGDGARTSESDAVRGTLELGNGHVDAILAAPNVRTLRSALEATLRLTASLGAHALAAPVVASLSRLSTLLCSPALSPPPPSDSTPLRARPTARAVDASPRIAHHAVAGGPPGEHAAAVLHSPWVTGLWETAEGLLLEGILRSDEATELLRASSVMYGDGGLTGAVSIPEGHDSLRKRLLKRAVSGTDATGPEGVAALTRLLAETQVPLTAGNVKDVVEAASVYVNRCTPSR